MTDAQFTMIGGLLVEIRDLLNDILASGTEASEECDHPEGSRIDMSTLSETHWICRACKFEYRPMTQS